MEAKKRKRPKTGNARAGKPERHKSHEVIHRQKPSLNPTAAASAKATVHLAVPGARAGSVAAGPSLEDELTRIGLVSVARQLDAQFTLRTVKGDFAVFLPRACISVTADGRLRLGHVCAGGGLYFSKPEILHVFPGVWCDVPAGCDGSFVRVNL
jgi:hypothetical protein